MMLTIALAERGSPQLVSLSDWSRYALEEPLRALANDGIVKVTRTGVGVIVTPRNFVGELRLPGVHVSIAPKSRALLTAMEALALQSRAKEARNFHSENLARKGDSEDPVSAFVRALAGCIAAGIPWTYHFETTGTSFPRGKLEVRDSIARFASRGMKHRIVVRNTKRAQPVMLGRVVHAAMGYLVMAPGATPLTLSHAARLSEAFERGAAFTSIREAMAAAADLYDVETAAGRSWSAEVAQRSYELLTREYRAAGDVRPIRGGLSHFRNLEHLWEMCVLRLVERSAVLQAFGLPEFHGLAAANWSLLDGGGPMLDPDVVVRRGEARTLIVDAKYKRNDVGNAVASTDVYQLYAYVRRVGANAGMLVHFSENEPGVAIVGTTPEGALIVSASISPAGLLADGESALARLLAGAFSVEQRLVQRSGDGLGELRRDGIANLPSDVLLGS